MRLCDGKRDSVKGLPATEKTDRWANDMLLLSLN